MSSWRKSVAGLLLVTLSSPSWAVVTIEHQAIDCIVRNTHARVEARYAPETVAQKRVYFRAPGTDDFYWVELAGAPPEAANGFLPKPHPTTASIEYYVAGEVSEADRAETERFAPVVSTLTFCQNEAKSFRQPADNEQVSIVLGLVRWGQAAVPEGFLPTNIASIVLPNGATTTLGEAMKAGGTQQSAAGQSASASSGAGGGLSTWAIVGGALGAAGVAAAVGGGGGGDGDSNNGGGSPSPLPSSCTGYTEATFRGRCGGTWPRGGNGYPYTMVDLRTSGCRCKYVESLTSGAGPTENCTFSLSGSTLSFSGCRMSYSQNLTECGTASGGVVGWTGDFVLTMLSTSPVNCSNFDQ